MHMPYCIKGIIFWLIMAPSCLYGQQNTEVKAVVSALKMNVLYIGVENPIHVAVPEVECDQLNISFSSGEITGTGCNYNAIPNIPGEGFIQIKVLDSGIVQTTYSVKFTIKHLPNPTPYIGNKSPIDDSIALAQVKSIPGIYARSPNLDFTVFYRIVHFKVSIIRSNTVLYSSASNNSYFTEEMASAFNNILRTGDLLTISEITVLSADSTLRKVAPLEFVIN